jgi:uncharacterized protein
MTPDWHSVVTLALVVPPAVGHVYQFVVLINVVSGTGSSESVLDQSRTALFAVFWASSAYLFWAHLHEPWWRWSAPLFWYAALCTCSGLVVMPLCSLRLALRRRPKGISGSSRLIDLAAREGAGALLGHAGLTWVLRLPRNESFRLVLRDWDLIIPGLPAALVDLQIVQVSDLHFAPCYSRHFFECVADACGEWNADLLFVTGDVVDHNETIAWVEPVLGRLEGRLGRAQARGLHDLARSMDNARGKRNHAGDRWNFGPVGPGLDARRDSTCRLSAALEPLAGSLLQGARLGSGADVLRAQSWRSDPAAGSRGSVCSQPLFPALRPRVLP